MKTKSIQLFKADNQTIIVIEGAGETLDELIMALLRKATGTEISIQDLHLNSVNTAKQEAPDLRGLPDLLKSKKSVIQQGTYQGMTPAQALAKDKEKALVALYQMANTLSDDDERKSICTACKGYMVNEMTTRLGVTDTVEIKAFLHTIEPMIDQELIAKIHGYQSLQQIVDFASPEELQQVYQETVLSLVQRGEKRR